MARIAILALLVAPSLAHAMILIDSFDGGYFKATITGNGSKDNFARDLDRNQVYAGHRYTAYTVGGNPFGYTTTFEVGLGEARVVTPGPEPISNDVILAYGQGFGSTFSMNLTSLPVFELDIDMEPEFFFAQTWMILVGDRLGRTATNFRWGLTDFGIEFLREGFVGDVDWSDVRTLMFRQSFSGTRNMPLVHYVTEFRAVPEPAGLLAAGAGALLLRKRRAPAS